MEFINDTTRYTSNVLDKGTQWLDNTAIVSILILALLVYAVFFAQRSYPPAVRFFEHPLVKILSFLFIIYISYRNVGLALAMLIALFAILGKSGLFEGFENEDTIDYPSVSDYMTAPSRASYQYADENVNQEVLLPAEQNDLIGHCPVDNQDQEYVRGKLDVLDNDNASSNYAPAEF
jgi:hypothetical protein